MATDMEQQKDRRRQIRRVGQDLLVVIDRRAFPVIDISTEGVSFQGSGYGIGEVVKIRVARLSDTSDDVAATVTVRAVEDNVIRGEFRPNMPLLHYIISHIGEATGAKPAYFGGKAKE